MATQALEITTFEEDRAVKRRRRHRVWLPVAVLALMLAALIGISLYDVKLMREDALALSRGVIGNLQSRIETEVAAYLEPVGRVVRFADDMLAQQDPFAAQPEAAMRMSLGIIENAPQLTALFIANPRGEFFMARRVNVADAPVVEFKLIRRPGGDEGKPVQHIVRRTAENDGFRYTTEPWDGYDPRTRSWYQEAAAGNIMGWTEVYPFFTTRQPGTTASIARRGEDARLVSVTGADVALQSISRFLANLSIGRTGIALIVDDAGRVIAHPQASLLASEGEGQFRLTRIDDLGDDAVQRAFDRFRVEGHGRRDFVLHDRRYISSVSSLAPLVQHAWSVLLVVPEDEFVGFVADNVRKTLLMGLAVIALAGLLAALVVRQGLRVDREALALLERQASLDAQGDAFGLLATHPALFEADGEDALAPVTEALAQATGVRRASLWQVGADRDTLVCVDCFDRETDGHVAGAVLARGNHPDLFSLLEAGETVGEVEVRTDARLESIERAYLSPLGCSALLCVPITAAGALAGALWLEDSRRSAWPADVRRFGRAIANLLALRGTALGTPPHAGPAGRPSGNTRPAVAARRAPEASLMIDSSLGDRRAATLRATLPQAAAQDSPTTVRVIERLACLAMRFTDPGSLTRPAVGAPGICTIEYLLDRIESAADEHGITYLKLLTDRIVATAPLDEPPDQGATQLADFALALQSVCEQVFAEQHAALAFRIGIDVGPVIASTLGRDERGVNLWGDALDMSRVMCDTGLAGEIQATGTVHELLKERYLFQVRGVHYLEGTGKLSTYLLSARL